VALQIDRAPSRLRTRRVRLFGGPGVIPEGPLRLAQLSGAPILPVFSARRGHRRYLVEAYPPIVVARDASDADLDRAAQRVADAMGEFLTEHPTDWFAFREV
jgi:KDO2-lipid IV(A) lauroyltransferase